MFEKISNSWELVKSSAKVLEQDRELMLFPVISAIGMLLLSAAFIIPMFATNFFTSLTKQTPGWAYFALTFLFYILQYFIIFFSNTALVGAAIIRLRGGDPTVRDGFKIAFNHIKPIFIYAVISATVGIILGAIRDRNKVLSKIVASTIGFIWNVATFLVVPILAVEDVGPIEAINRSVGYLKKTWGEQIAGNFSIGAIFAAILVVLAAVAGVVAGTATNLGVEPWVYLAIGSVIVIFVLGISLISSTLNGIYKAAVYQYASTGDSGFFFDESTIKEAFHSIPPKSTY